MGTMQLSVSWKTRITSQDSASIAILGTAHAPLVGVAARKWLTGDAGQRRSVEKRLTHLTITNPFCLVWLLCCCRFCCAAVVLLSFLLCYCCVLCVVFLCQLCCSGLYCRHA